MKYLEELKPGECFCITKELFIVTMDFKKDGSRMVVNLNSGISRWMNGSTVCDISPIFTLDNENNTFIAVRPQISNENHTY
jgi:hypothetical protein